MSSAEMRSARGVVYELVTVGNPGNAADTTGFGAVNYEYQIGMYDVTIGQYVEFLNAVARTDSYGLYSLMMATDLNVAGIDRSSSSGAYSSSVIGPSGYVPPAASVRRIVRSRT